MAQQKTPRYSGKSRSENGKFIGYWDSAKWTDRNGKDGPFKQLKGLYDAAIAASEPLITKKAELAAGGKYTPAGMAEILRQTALDGPVTSLRKTRAEGLSKFRREIETRKAKMKPFDHDPQDIVGELRRQEVRRWLSSLSEGDRTKAVRKASDPMIKEAALSVPAELSGLLPSTCDDMREELIRARHGDEMEALDMLEEAVTTVERAFDAARDEIRQAIDMPEHEFDAAAKPIEAKIDAETKDSGPSVDVDGVAEMIKAMKFEDRHKLIDLALERQVDDAKVREPHRWSSAA